MDGFNETRRRTKLEADKRVEVTLKLEPVPRSSMQLDVETKKAEVSTHPYKLWGHVAFWSGVGLTAFGGVSMALSAKAGSDYEDGDLDAEASSHTWATLMYAGFGIGATLIATGAVLWLLSPDDGPQAGQASAALGPTPDFQGMVFSVGGRW
jgi:hypothetical protein